MNHDNAHCKDFNAECPVDCYRAMLEIDLRTRWAEFIGVPITYQHLKGTSECKLKERENEQHD